MVLAKINNQPPSFKQASSDQNISGVRSDHIHSLKLKKAE
jgi:hypothetical protein